MKSAPTEELRVRLNEFNAWSEPHKELLGEVIRREEAQKARQEDANNKVLRITRWTFIAALVAALIGLAALLNDLHLFPLSR